MAGEDIGFSAVPEFVRGSKSVAISDEDVV
jgi:hypothetical protein